MADAGAKRLPAPIGYIRNLWTGALPLPRVFWTDMLAVGTAVNVAATVIALLTFAAGVPVAIGVIVHLAPIPYNLLLLMGVWQSASREASQWSWPAQIIATLWFVGAIVV